MCGQVPAGAFSPRDQAGEEDEAESPPRIWGWVLPPDGTVRLRSQTYSPDDQTVGLRKKNPEISSFLPTEFVRKRTAPPWRRNIKSTSRSRPSCVSSKFCSANRKSSRPCDRKLQETPPSKNMSGKPWRKWLSIIELLNDDKTTLFYHKYNFLRVIELKVGMIHFTCSIFLSCPVVFLRVLMSVLSCSSSSATTNTNMCCMVQVSNPTNELTLC